MFQHTINNSISFSGQGLHTGLGINMVIEPAAPDYDLSGHPVFPTVADYVSYTERGTVLENGVWRVSTVEHLLSALYALEIDNVLIKVDAPEIPILNGSAEPFVLAFLQAGIKQQNTQRQVFTPKEKIEYDNGQGSYIALLPDNHFNVDVTIGYDSTILGNQRARLNRLSDYPAEIASARTFCFVREIEPLLDLGLIKGGNLDNALVIYERQISQEKLDRLADLCHVNHLPADRLGYLSEPKFDNEAARHKLLDIIGDISLVGVPIQGKLIASRPGHTVNTQFAKIVREKMLEVSSL